jgi:hypothetical protein
MKRLPIAAFACSLFVLSCQAADAVRRVENRIGKTTFESVLLDTALDQAPRWAESEPNPPYAARSALNMAKTYLQMAFTTNEVEVWVVRSITLEPVGGKGQWVYVVAFRAGAFERIQTGIHRDVDVIILMNGAVVPFRRLASR